MHGTVAASAKCEGMGDDRKPEHLFRGSDPQSLAELVTFGHPSLYGEKGEGREGDQDHMCHSLGKTLREHWTNRAFHSPFYFILHPSYLVISST